MKLIDELNYISRLPEDEDDENDPPPVPDGRN